MSSTFHSSSSATPDAYSMMPSPISSAGWRWEFHLDIKRAPSRTDDLGQLTRYDVLDAW